VREYGGDLERTHHAEPRDLRRLLVGDVRAVEIDATAGRRQELGREIEDGRFPGAVRADQRVDRATVNVERQVLDRREPEKLLGDVLEPERGFGRPARPRDIIQEEVDS
jgi:hypothetical protein